MPATNLYQAIRQQLERDGERIAMRQRTGSGWRDISCGEVSRTVRSLASALVELGVGEQHTVGICSPNRPEWTMADLGCLAARAVPVPIYATLTAEQAAFIVRDAGVELLLASGGETLATARRVRAERPSLRVVCFDPAPDLDPSRGELGWAGLLELGQRAGREREAEERQARVAADDLLTLIYTSGTTGEPKGVMLTQGNLMAAMEIHDLRLDDLTADDSSLCFLPLAHVFERCWTYYVLYRGMVNHYLDDPSRVVDALREARPTVLCVVPRLLEKIHGGIHGRLQAAPRLRRRLFDWAVRTGHRAMLERKDGRPLPLGLRLRHRLADRLVLARVRELLGGRIRMIPCAGAPLDRQIEEFFYACGVRVAHGYGLTETTATVSFHQRQGFHFGTVGTPMPSVEVRIGPGDEIQVRGPTVMKGYHNRPEATAEAFDDGWLRTGDAGALDEAGCLVVTDRIKDLIKTSGGKYVAPQAIEARLGSDPLVEQVAVVGDLRRYVTALIVPAFALLEPLATERGFGAASRAELVARPEVVALYQGRVDAVNRDLARFEQVKRFTLLERPFTVEAGELTPTLKIRRRAVAERYRAQVDAMYVEE